MTPLEGAQERRHPKRPSSWAIREQRLLEALRAGTASRRFKKARRAPLPDGTLPWHEGKALGRAVIVNGEPVWPDLLGLDGRPAPSIEAIYTYAGPRARTKNCAVCLGGVFLSPALANAWRRILERGITGADVEPERDFVDVARCVEVEGFTFDGGWSGSVSYRARVVADRLQCLAPHLLRELLESVDRTRLDAEVASQGAPIAFGDVRENDAARKDREEFWIQVAAVLLGSGSHGAILRLVDIAGDDLSEGSRAALLDRAHEPERRRTDALPTNVLPFVPRAR